MPGSLRNCVLTTTFKVFDKDGNGKISKSELGEVLRYLSNLNDSELDDVMTRFGGTDGCFNLEQFISFHADSPSNSARVLARASSAGSGHADEIHDPDVEALKSAFVVFDIDKNNYISAEELQKMMLTLSDKHTSLDES